MYARVTAIINAIFCTQFCVGVELCLILNELYEKCVAGSRDVSIVYFSWRIIKFCFTWKVNIDSLLRCPGSSTLAVKTNISCLFVKMKIHLSLGIPDKIVWVAAGGGATISGIPASLSLLRFSLLFVLSQRQNKALSYLFALINKRKGCDVVGPHVVRHYYVCFHTVELHFLGLS